MSGLRQRERKLITKLRIYFETFAFGRKDISKGEQNLDTTLLNSPIYTVWCFWFSGFRERITRR